jgi:hypothetical protein
MFNLRSTSTLTEWAEKLERQPRWHPVLPSHQPLFPTHARASVPVAASPAKVEPVKRRICAHCGTQISFEEGKFCWNNEQRFGGLAYCREHQALFPQRKTTPATV